MKHKPTPPDNKGKTYNTHKVDKRIVLFRQYYTLPTSPTFQNVLQSAIKAGYSQQYAESLSAQAPKWFVEMQQDMTLVRSKMLASSEQHFREMLETPSDTPDKDRLKIKQATAVHISETLGKDLYSKRNEVTGADGRKLFTNETASDKDIALDTLFIGVASDDKA